MSASIENLKRLDSSENFQYIFGLNVGKIHSSFQEGIPDSESAVIPLTTSSQNLRNYIELSNKVSYDPAYSTRSSKV